ncbi:MAG: hypothetical protein HYS81_04045 [Candidatus Aenigmatarchaeota archaeon]|nr:MAG: hypothetical protein HYS81_04045 [Candidatus Aenigmarchaeota archaeon]
MKGKKVHEIEIAKFKPYTEYVGMFERLENNFGYVTGGLFRSHDEIFGLKENGSVRRPFAEVISWNDDVVGYEVTQDVGHSFAPPTPKITVGAMYFVVGRDKFEKGKAFEKELSLSEMFPNDPRLKVTVRIGEESSGQLREIMEKRPLESAPPRPARRPL